MPAHCFCETIRPELIKQPANTLSGAAFAGVSLLVLVSTMTRRRTPPQNLITSHPVYPIIFAAASLIIAIGTVFYHASLTFWGQTADVLGMYLIAMFLVLYNAARIQQMPPVAVATLYVVGNALLLSGLILVPEARRYVFAALIVLALTLELVARYRERNRGNVRLLQVSVGALAIGFVVWSLDITRVVCAPNSWVQGHALWHVAGAIALWFVFLYYKSATPMADH